MKFSPREVDHLTLCQAGLHAQRRLARGTRLNYPEAAALIAHVVVERARDGNLTVAALMDSSRRLLGVNNVMANVPALLNEVQVEATFPDGTKLVTVHSPINVDHGDLTMALYGSFLPTPLPTAFAPLEKEEEDSIPPGHMWPSNPNASHILLNPKSRCGDPVVLSVFNTADRPIQVGSHYHFMECNPHLRFDRRVAYGRRLNIISGTAVRFEPGEEKTVSLIGIAGKKLICGGNNLGHGIVETIGNPSEEIMTNIQTLGFAHQPQEGLEDAMEQEGLLVDPLQYLGTFGPTMSDCIRLGDTALVITIERDLCAGPNGTNYGDEIKFGGGKVLRDGLGQSSSIPANVAVDTIITNATIIDYTGIYKADVGIKDKLIHGIGKGGNPDVMDGVDPCCIVGVTTEVIAGEGMILTAGGMDAHVHFINWESCIEALASGITTLLGGGTGPATGTNATTCTPSPNHIKMMMQSTDSLPMNFGFTGKGNSSGGGTHATGCGLTDQVVAGVCGLKLHEDWGTTPSTIDHCLTVAETHDIQVTIHTDTLNESTMCEGSIAATKNRTIHAYHTEGAGGGHAPDIIRVAGETNVLPSSTNPTRPYTRNTMDEHLDMLMVCHHLDKRLKEDVSFAESRIRAETIAAEDILHDMGAISIIASDAQAMGRIGETITRTWQTAHKMKIQRGQLPQDKAKHCVPDVDDNAAAADMYQQMDNERVKRYIAKYTINPAIAHGMSDTIGSIEIGKLADLVLWNPAFFGAKPELVIKGGQIAYSQMGDANASIPTPQPVMMRPQFIAMSALAAAEHSCVFVSKASVDQNVVTQYKLSKKIVPVQKCRGLQKQDMKLNDARPDIKVDPETYQVTADGELLTCAPMDKLPLAQKYFMF